MRILKGSMRINIQNEDLHLFATNLIENRLTFSHLPNEKPKGNIKDLLRSTFSLSMNEWRQYADNAKVIVGWIVLQFLPQFKVLKGIVPECILHVHSKEMERQSSIVSMPIINANEAKYEDCVSILRMYEKWIAEIYFKAGLLQEIPQADNPPVPAGPATPGQDPCHQQPTSNDPVMWHTKASFLQYSYSFLCKPTSVNQVGNQHL